MYVCIEYTSEQGVSIQYSVSLLQFHNIIKQCLIIMDPGGPALSNKLAKARGSEWICLYWVWVFSMYNKCVFTIVLVHLSGFISVEELDGPMVDGVLDIPL
jgi:hypothetical protein